MLYQLLVPSTIDGQEISVDYHNVFDITVSKIAGGLTILHDCKGRWTSPDGSIVYENMIPVLIHCTREQLEDILDYALRYYQQQSVFAFVMSTEVIIKKRPDNVVEFKHE
jgi:hypothetical protein